jgi:hypothetical protein
MATTSRLASPRRGLQTVVPSLSRHRHTDFSSQLTISRRESTQTHFAKGKAHSAKRRLTRRTTSVPAVSSSPAGLKSNALKRPRSDRAVPLPFGRSSRYSGQPWASQNLGRKSNAAFSDIEHRHFGIWTGGLRRSSTWSEGRPGTAGPSRRQRRSRSARPSWSCGGHRGRYRSAGRIVLSGAHRPREL